MAAAERPDDASPGDNSSIQGKRDREYGMYQDPIVMERTKCLEEGLQREIDVRTEERRLARVYEFIRKHRPGTPIGIRRTIRGSYNAVFGVDYTDGSAILRVVVPGNTAFPDEKVRNEVATMRYIEKMTSIPVPHIYHWGTAAENPLGLGAFIIMDYIPHEQSLCDLLRDPTLEDTSKGYLDPDLSRGKLENVYRQLANILLQLSTLEAPKIGALREHRGSFVVGSRPLTQDMNDLIVQGGIPPSIFPPEDTTYSTSDEWYASLADFHVAHLTFQHNRAIDSADDCRDKFVARHLFRQRVRQGKLLEHAASSTIATTPPTAATAEASNKKPKTRQKRKRETFRLWIDDFRPHNILIDADLNIVGVIDWEWAYFAPASFAHDPPWWLLLGRPEYWRGTVLDFRDEFAGVLDVFLDALRAAEEDFATRGDDGDGPSKGKEEEEWSIDRHIEALSLEADEGMRLSERMRQSWDSGAFWANYAARRCYGFDPVFWEFLDERFFGDNVQGGYEGRIHLLSEKARDRMEWLVERKVEENKEQKIVDWDPEEAKAYLAQILADLG